ncbi:MAG TPA: TonB-dependent receptor plug domain-containing protein, partial [Bacteroidales bacterium]|nr:TonB-dependent receptor plug domain-containing protein [Bacteroidales bacterium]
GFASQSLLVKPGETKEMNIVLSPSAELKEVVITDSVLNKVSDNSQMSNFQLPVEYVKEIPALLGEKDVFKALQLLPGVQKGNEGSSGLYVRGGGPDQNLIILDDATVYNANHLFGFFSLFNGDALKSIELIKGGFPARYGGRLSSVVDMNMKDGNREKLCGEGGIGVISSRLTLEGPVIKNKSSFLISGRRTYLDALMRPFMNKANGTFGYYFYDLNAKINYEFDKKNRLYLSGYFGRDKFHFTESYDLSSSSSRFKAGLFWENATATFRWNHVFSNKLFSNASLIFSNYGLNIYEEEKYDDSRFSLDYSSGIRDLGLKYDFAFYPNTNHTIRYGLQSTWHRFKPSAVVLEITSTDDFVSEISSIHTLENSLYIEDEWKWNRWRGNIGIRAYDFIADSCHYISPEPRFAAGFMLTELSSIKASWTMMNQSVHLLSNTGMGLPTDLWVPSTKNLRPQRAWQAALGYARDLPKGLALTIEGYYKKSDDVIGYREGASFLMINDPTDANQFSWEDNITVGQSWSYGGEFLLQKKTGKWTGWVGYTLSWTQLQFDELNSGKKFYAKYDRRHDISIVNMYKINDVFTLSCVWVFSSGNALNLPVETYDAVPDYTTE